SPQLHGSADGIGRRRRSLIASAGHGTFRPAPDTHPAFFANSPESGQLRTATRSFPAVLAAALPARTSRHEQVPLRPPDDVCWPAVQSSHALLLLDVRKPEMVPGLRN